MEYINIVFGCDKFYQKYLLVAIFSIFEKFNFDKFNLNIYIFDGGIQKKYIKKIHNFVNLYNRLV